MNSERIKTRPSWFLRTGTISHLLDTRHCSHTRVAQMLKLSRTHWSQLFNRRRSLTPDVRHTMLACPIFKDIPEDQLWEKVEER